MTMTSDNDSTKNQWHCLDHESVSKCSSECYLQKLFGLLGKKHALTIIRLLLLNEKLRFNEIAEKVTGSPKTITERLKELKLYGLVNREMFNEIPIRVEYSLTEKGRELEKSFEMFSRWAEKMQE